MYLGENGKSLMQRKKAGLWVSCHIHFFFSYMVPGRRITQL